MVHHTLTSGCRTHRQHSREVSMATAAHRNKGMVFGVTLAPINARPAPKDSYLISPAAPLHQQ